jgi:hypothetical protein
MGNALRCRDSLLRHQLTRLFDREHPEASEVFVTGTFDDWGKTQKLDKQASGFFEKSVALPSKDKVLYKVSEGEMKMRA